MTFYEANVFISFQFVSRKKKDLHRRIKLSPECCTISEGSLTREKLAKSAVCETASQSQTI